PDVDEFAYTFDSLARVTRRFLGRLGVTRYTVLVHDYGAPIAWRLALADPGAVAGIISQNGNAYEDGFVPDFWAPIWQHSANPTPETEHALRFALSREAIQWQYTHGVPDASTRSEERRVGKVGRSRWAQN